MNRETFAERMKEHNESIVKLRELFIQEYEKNSFSYNKDDYAKIVDTKEEWHCWRYLNYYQYDLDKSFENMKSNLKWRHEFKVNEVQLCDFPKELWLFSTLICAGEDKNGNLIIHFRGRFTYKPPPSLEVYYHKFLFHVIDSLDRQTCITKKFVFVFDQSDTVFANVDLNLSKWSISVRNSMPSRLEAVLIVGIPFLIKPIVNMVVSWLPKEFKHLIHCGSYEELLDSRIDKDQQLEYSGGKLIEAHYRMAPSCSKWFRDIKTFQNEASQEAFNEWIKRKAPDENYRQTMIDLQEKHDAENHE